MDTNYTLPVYVCSLCGKPFAQERQHRRHQAYCRKTHRTRPRSCRACNQSKIKCNFRAPCHQCTRKGIACVYQQPKRVHVANHDSTAYGNVTSSSSNSSTDRSAPVSSTDLLENGEHESAQVSLNFDQPEYMHDRDDFITSTMANPEAIDSTAIITSPTSVSSPLKGIHNFMPLLQTDDLDFMADFSPGKALDFMFPVQPHLFPSFPCSQVSTTAAHFSRNKILTPVQQIFSSMIIDMIRAYPLMMTRRETFPPFIHPYCYLYEGTDTLPQVLTNCMGIAQLYVARTDDTRPFVWATIMAEVRDLVEKRHSMNTFELFSALQASLMYMIMRAIDAVPFKAEQDLELIRAHEIICDYALEQIGSHPVPEVSDPHRKWREWIFDESTKRIAWVWFMLSLVYHLRTGTPCRVADITRIVPLPCTKTEWEAQTEEDWRKEFNKARNAQTATSMLVFGDLIDTHRASPAERPHKARELESWNAGVDNLGILLNVAVYMTPD